MKRFGGHVWPVRRAGANVVQKHRAGVFGTRMCRVGWLVALLWAGVALVAGGTAFCSSNATNAESGNVIENGPAPKTLAEYFSFDPAELTLQENVPQKYVLSTKWRNRDLYGNLTGEFIVKGDYTRALGEGIVRWNDVFIIAPPDSAGAAPDSSFFEGMEGWSYKSPEDIATAGFFNRLPSDDSQHALRTLIWDAVAFEVFAWTYFDKLRLNETVAAEEFEDFTAPMADWGKLIMKGLRLTWTGVTELEGEPCAVIDYRSWANPVESSSLVMSIKGRSLYWGEIWISLEDKQIERATMNEDVIVEMSFGSDTPVKRQEMQREVTFEKVLPTGEEQ
jgi:hypothetical protein